MIGAGIIVVGLYSVVWGKNRERSAANSHNKQSYNNDDHLPVSDMKTIDQINHQTTPKSLHAAEPWNESIEYIYVWENGDDRSIYTIAILPISMLLY